jgi:NitT/TauT family transport system substrate-binding protein
MIARLVLGVGLAAALCVTCLVRPAAAEKSELHIAQQPGLSYLVYVVMQHEKMVEQAAAAAGLGDVKVTWFKFSGGSVMNDALLAGDLDIANSGPGQLVTLWAVTRTSLKIKGIAAYNALPAILMVRNPAVKSIKDLTENDRIALPSVKTSIQAMYLEMESEKVFGDAMRLDHLTVSRGHPDAMAAMLQPHGEITAHFSTLPYVGIEEQTPGVHAILTGAQAIGGRATSGVAYTTTRFHDQNPKLFGAFFAALKTAMEFVNTRRLDSARIYLEMTHEKTTPDAIVAELAKLDDPYDMAPQGMLKMAQFMYKHGEVKAVPDRWQDLFFPEAYGLPGS